MFFSFVKLNKTLIQYWFEIDKLTYHLNRSLLFTNMTFDSELKITTNHHW